MHRGLRIFAKLVALLALAALSAPAQSLADAARQNRMNKPATPAQKVYTNDDLPTSASLNAVGSESPDQSSAPEPRKPAAKDPKAEAKAAEERAKLEVEWRGRFKTQRAAIALLEREVAALDREVKLRPAAVTCSYGTLCDGKAAK